MSRGWCVAQDTGLAVADLESIASSIETINTWVSLSAFFTGSSLRSGAQHATFLFNDLLLLSAMLYHGGRTGHSCKAFLAYSRAWQVTYITNSRTPPGSASIVHPNCNVHYHPTRQ